jgi:hypothetical protein
VRTKGFSLFLKRAYTWTIPFRVATLTFALYINYNIIMSTQYASIAACATKIFESVGHCDKNASPLTMSGKEPTLPAVDLEELLPKGHTLDPDTRARLWNVVRVRLSSLREHFLRQYWQTSRQLYSTRHLGLDDSEVESHHLRIYESQYDRCLEDVTRLLAKLLSRLAQPVDHRNTRGGFGDVSPPHITQS